MLIATLLKLERIRILCTLLSQSNVVSQVMPFDGMGCESFFYEGKHPDPKTELPFALSL
jgi:hypothetical protein